MDIVFSNFSSKICSFWASVWDDIFDRVVVSVLPLVVVKKVDNVNDDFFNIFDSSTIYVVNKNIENF